MKHISRAAFGLLASATLLTGGVGVATAENGATNTASESPKEVTQFWVDMYRVYNPNSGEHFYTGSTLERDSLVAAGWRDEGLGWYADMPTKSGMQYLTPVHRLYNPYAGDHHYTDSVEERDFLVQAGWNDEGIGWYYSLGRPYDTVYRQYNPNATTGTHNYTLSEVERDALIAAGWKNEGVAWAARYAPDVEEFKQQAAEGKIVITVPADRL